MLPLLSRRPPPPSPPIARRPTPPSPVLPALPPALRQRVRAFDDAVDRAVGSVRGHRRADRLFYELSELGDFSLVWHLVGATRGLTSDRRADEAIRLSVGLGAESLLVNGVVKSFFRRSRPVFDGIRPHYLRRPRSSSFPSGHASAAFFAAGVLSERSRAWPAWYGLAALVASSRVYVKIHHASDVIAGAATGYVLARLFRKVWPAPAPEYPTLDDPLEPA